MNNYYRSDGWVKTSQGPAVPGAQIWVCLQPANVTPPITPPRTLPVPWVGPNPQALIYSDAGVTPITQPVITDGFGHYDFYALPGLYTVVVMFGGKVQQFYIDQTIGNAGSNTPSPLVLSTNGTPNFNQAALNFVQGSGITLATDNFGNMTITGSVPPPPSPTLTLQTNEVPNVSQTLLDLHASTGISLVDNGAGRVTVTNTAPAAPAVPQQYWQTFGYRNFVEAGSIAVEEIGTYPIADGDIAASTYTNPTSTEPGYRNQLTGLAATNITTIWCEGTLTTTGPTGTPSSNITRFVARLKLNNTTNMRCYVGFSLPIGPTVQNVYFTDTPNTGYIMFRYSTTADGTTWHGVVGTDNSHQTVVNTGVAVNTSLPQDLLFTYDGITLSFSVDGSVPVTITTNIPAGPLRMLGSVDNQNQTQACACSWSYMLYSVK